MDQIDITIDKVCTTCRTKTPLRYLPTLVTLSERITIEHIFTLFEVQMEMVRVAVRIPCADVSHHLACEVLLLELHLIDQGLASGLKSASCCPVCSCSRCHIPLARFSA